MWCVKNGVMNDLLGGSSPCPGSDPLTSLVNLMDNPVSVAPLLHLPYSFRSSLLLLQMCAIRRPLVGDEALLSLVSALFHVSFTVRQFQLLVALLLFIVSIEVGSV